MAKKTKCELIRRRLGYTQTQMADRIGVNQGTVSKLEAGAKPSRPIAKLLDYISAEIPT